MHTRNELQRQERQQTRALIREAVARAGTVPAAAVDLGLSKQALYQRIESLHGRVVTTRVSRVEFDDDEADSEAAAA